MAPGFDNIVHSSGKDTIVVNHLVS